MPEQIKFIKGTKSDIPKTGKRLSAKEVKALNAVFQKHIHKPVAGPAKAPCHVIACVVSKKYGLWCYYHCVPKG
jgi:hypothetical protein